MRAIAAGEAPAAVMHGAGPSVGTLVVPGDAWRGVRGVLAIAYAAAFVAWVRQWGLIVDRISILLAVVLLLVVANVGRPWYRWRQLAGDVVLYGLLMFLYAETRGAAQRLGAPLQVESVRNIDRVLFFGTDPTVWLQERFYDATVVRWYDVAASIVYYAHFVVPFAVIAVLWIVNRRQWVRFMRRWSAVLLVSCVSFVVVPTAPPWMAAGGDLRIRLAALPPLARPAGRGWSQLGLERFTHAWEIGKNWVNEVAAMPSLHAAYSLLVVAFFLPSVRRRSIRAALVAYPVAMGVALVYLAEHYAADVLAGWLIVGLSFVVWNGVERRARRRRVERCRRALPAPAHAGST